MRCFLLAVAAAMFLASCGGESPARERGSRLSVVTTVAPITSIVASVVGDAADVRGVVPEGTNSHTFEPPPSVAEDFSSADVIFMNGLQLEEPTKELAQENKRDGTPVVELGDRTLSPDRYVYDFSFPKEGGKPNPHLWTNPPMARTYAEVVRDTMAKADPTNAALYRANFGGFAAAVDRFDAAMRTSFATVPPDHRKLLTYHDAYAYFAEEYGWEVIGAIQVSDFEDPAPKEVAALIDQVKAERVPAIFGSELFPSPVLERIGRETGVRYVDVLRDDDLPGKPGDPEHSWFGLMRFDYVTMVEALGGDASSLRQFAITDLAPDRARYPQ